MQELREAEALCETMAALSQDWIETLIADREKMGSLGATAATSSAISPSNDTSTI